TRLKWTRGMGSSGHSPCKCLQCSRCHASISLSLHPLAMHHNQHTASLMVPTHLVPTPLRRATTESKVRAATGVVFVGEATEVS
uniref:Uncharacterized protein n=1 Tax=Aegilops tauschii subsp. strangulata TaxID=200361 RepID=A0A453J5U9_AEGTS